MFIRAALTLTALALGATLGAHAATAQGAKADTGIHVTGSAKLKAEAKVGEADARATALKLVPSGRIRAGELERENGKLIYSFELKVPGKSGIEEVNVDAMTGAVVAHEHESPAAEKKEAAHDARAAKRSTKGSTTP